MKLKLIASTLFVFTIMFNANAQNFDLPKKHNFGAGVLAGYDLDEKAWFMAQVDYMNSGRFKRSDSLLDSTMIA